MSRSLRLAAAVLPLLGLAGLWGMSDHTFRQGTEWEVPIDGFDPRDFLRGHEGGHRHDAVKRALLADPHLGRVVDVLLLELEGMAVVDVVADVLFVGQHPVNQPPGPRATTLG